MRKIKSAGETVRLWVKSFEHHGGKLRLSEWGRHVRNWIMDDPVRRHHARAWLRHQVRRKPKIGDTKGVFKISMFHEWLNTKFLKQYHENVAEVAALAQVVDVEKDVVRKKAIVKVSLGTALVWAKKLGLEYMSRKKSYYVDNHDRADVLLYRDAKYLPEENALELQQYV